MVRWSCEGTLVAMSNQCLLSSCCSESIEGPVYESPRGCHALDKPNLRAVRQNISIHALHKLQPTRPPRVVSYVPVVTDNYCKHISSDYRRYILVYRRCFDPDIDDALTRHRRLNIVDLGKSIDNFLIRSTLRAHIDIAKSSILAITFAQFQRKTALDLCMS